LAASLKRSDFSIDDVPLDILDKAISGFGYFYHGEYGDKEKGDREKSLVGAEKGGKGSRSR
jgi:hypothetical protein